MALNSITFVKETDNVVGKFRQAMFDIVMPSSYSTNGEAFAAADLPGQMFKHIFAVQVVGGNHDAGALHISYDNVNKKIQAWYTSGDGTADDIAAEVGAADDIDAYTFRVMVTGY